MDTGREGMCVDTVHSEGMSRDMGCLLGMSQDIVCFVGVRLDIGQNWGELWGHRNGSKGL